MWKFEDVLFALAFLTLEAILMRFRIATFNLENLDETESAPTLADRFPVLRPPLERLRADVLCLQEIHGQERPDQPRQLHALRALLAGTAYEGFYIEHTKTTRNEAYDVRNLVIVSRYPIRDVQQFRNDLIDPPQYRQVTADPPEAEADPVRVERPILYAKIGVAPQAVVHLINIHLKSRTPSNVDGQQQSRFVWRTAYGWAEGYFISSMKRVSQALEVRMLVDRIFDDEPDARIVVCGDFNAHPGEVPVEAIAGRIENTNNEDLIGRELMPCENTIPETERYTYLHHGQKRLLDHMLISRRMLQHYRRSEIHNETLHDESIAFRYERKFPESDHAPFVAEFDLADVSGPAP